MLEVGSWRLVVSKRIPMSDAKLSDCLIVSIDNRMLNGLFLTIMVILPNLK